MTFFSLSRATRRGLLYGLAALSFVSAPALAAPRRVAKAKARFVLGRGRVLAPGIVWNQVQLPSPAGGMRVWIYRPAEAQIAGNGKFPVVFIAPAGTPLYFGNRLGSGDSPEHLPYVRAGFIVVAYEIDGAVGDGNNADEVEVGAREFIRANAGLNNGITAINFALTSIPRINTRRLYVAGHSSAGTLSLQMAQHDPRIAACVAYAPCTDLEERIDDAHIRYWDNRIPGFARFIQRFSPIDHPATLRCPTFLFHADDDSNVPLSDNYSFARLVRRTNPRLFFVRVASGNHYDSMIQQGIPTAIRWLQSRPEAARAPKSRAAKKVR